MHLMNGSGSNAAGMMMLPKIEVNSPSNIKAEEIAAKEDGANEGFKQYADKVTSI
jgi:hypothetical protein